MHGGMRRLKKIHVLLNHFSCMSNFLDLTFSELHGQGLRQIHAWHPYHYIFEYISEGQPYTYNKFFTNFFLRPILIKNEGSLGLWDYHELKLWGMAWLNRIFFDFLGFFHFFDFFKFFGSWGMVNP